MKIELPSDISQLLGGYSVDGFLARYWHKKPLLIRKAIPGFKSPVSKARLFELAGRDDVDSRIVEHAGQHWNLTHGPFAARAMRRRAAPPWTLLVQGVNHCSAPADRLLRRFEFIPAARMDDLMISWAVDGGGVGPHFDSYDVFLLQAQGTRRWRVSMQRDRKLLADAPLKILRDFRPAMEWVLEPGDMLYLPPGCAHDGVALGECMTYSIGFRAPSAAELARGLLEHLADQVKRRGMYADPHLKAARQPALLDDAYLDQARRLIGRIEPSRAQIADFLGRYLSEPKANVFFDPPRRAAGRAAFESAVRARGLRLDAKTRALHRGRAFFINGETSPLPPGCAALKQLADSRMLDAGATLPAAAQELLYAWYTHGWLHLGSTP